MLPIIIRIFIDALYLLSLSATCKSDEAVQDFKLDRNLVDILQYELQFIPRFRRRTFLVRCILVVKTNYDAQTDLNLKYYKKNLDIDLTELKIQQLDTKNNADPKSRIPNKTDINRNIAIGDIFEEYFPGNWSAGTYAIYFNSINGSLQNNLQGFYLDQYPDENGYAVKFLTTQFGPIGARFAFPCFDEPYFRSKFKISLIRPKEYTCVISNAKLKNSTPTPSGKLIKDEFEPTDKISPSSLAFTISKMGISEEMRGCIHRIVARPEILKLKQHEYVATIINRIYEEIQEYLNISCRLQTLYHIALPSNRMKFESLGSYWGINHYKEDVLIISNVTSSEMKESSTISIAKLIAQQWFLSYLMIDSWKWAWLNEGLTMYLAYNVIDKIYPEWKVKERLIIKTRLAMEDNSGYCFETLAVEAKTPMQIEAKFSEITVYKGTALITMMERMLPKQTFREMLTNFIQEKKWSTYKSKDLYDKMESSLKLINCFQSPDLPSKVSEIMSTWENQWGFPIVTVTRNYDSNLETVNLTQRLFSSRKPDENHLWTIPINYATKYYPDFSNTRPSLWLESSTKDITIKWLKQTDWLILNNQATYFYRVNYDDQNWIAISKALLENHEVIHYLNRMQIIDDAFNLAEFGMLSYPIALTVTEYIKDEREYGPLMVLKKAFQSINKKIIGSKLYEKFRKFVKIHVEHIYDQCKNQFKLELSNPSNKKFHRSSKIIEMLFSWLCDLNSQVCQNRMYRLERSQYLKLSNYLEKYKMCNAMRAASINEWNNNFEIYESFKNKSIHVNSSSATNIFNALGCSEDIILQERFLRFVIRFEEHKLIKAINIIISKGGNGIDLILNFIYMLFGHLNSVFAPEDIKDILNKIGSRVTTEEQFGILSKFLKENENYENLINPSVIRAKQNLEWRNKHLRSIESYLKTTRSAGTKHCNTVLLLVLMISYYANLIFR